MSYPDKDTQYSRDCIVRDVSSLDIGKGVKVEQGTTPDNDNKDICLTSGEHHLWRVSKMQD